MSTDTKQLLRKLRKLGWQPVRLKGQHYRVVSPDTGQVVVFSSTPGDHRNLKNVRGDLRKAGLPRDVV